MFNKQNNEIIAYVGETKEFPIGVNPGRDWLPCNGTEVNLTNYPHLPNLIGNQWDTYTTLGELNLPFGSGHAETASSPLVSVIAAQNQIVVFANSDNTRFRHFVTDVNAKFGSYGLSGGKYRTRFLNNRFIILSTTGFYVSNANPTFDNITLTKYEIPSIVIRTNTSRAFIDVAFYNGTYYFVNNSQTLFRTTDFINYSTSNLTTSNFSIHYSNLSGTPTLYMRNSVSTIYTITNFTTLADSTTHSVTTQANNLIEEANGRIFYYGNSTTIESTTNGSAPVNHTIANLGNIKHVFWYALDNKWVFIGGAFTSGTLAATLTTGNVVGTYAVGINTSPNGVWLNSNGTFNIGSFQGYIQTSIVGTPTAVTFNVWNATGYIAQVNGKTYSVGRQPLSQNRYCLFEITDNIYQRLGSSTASFTGTDSMHVNTMGLINGLLTIVFTSSSSIEVHIFNNDFTINQTLTASRSTVAERSYVSINNNTINFVDGSNSFKSYSYDITVLGNANVINTGGATYSGTNMGFKTINGMTIGCAVFSTLTYILQLTSHQSTGAPLMNAFVPNASLAGNGITNIVYGNGNYYLINSSTVLRAPTLGNNFTTMTPVLSGGVQDVNFIDNTFFGYTGFNQLFSTKDFTNYNFIGSVDYQGNTLNLAGVSKVGNRLIAHNNPTSTTSGKWYELLPRTSNNFTMPNIASTRPSTHTVFMKVY